LLGIRGVEADVSDQAAGLVATLRNDGGVGQIAVDFVRVTGQPYTLAVVLAGGPAIRDNQDT